MPTREHVTLALCLLAIVQVTARQPPAEGELSDEDRQVIAVVLSDDRTRAPVLDLTWPMCGAGTQSDCFSPLGWDNAQNWGGVPDTAALKAALKTRNAASWRFGPFAAYPTVPGAATRALLAPSGAKAFAAAYPDLATVLQVGAPGFSADRRRALIYVESRCTSRGCSQGRMVLVERDGAGWRSRDLWGWGSGAATASGP